MKHDSFEFDRQLYDLLCHEHHQSFTIRQLRDAYVLTMEGSPKLAAVRIYVYEQIRRLVRAGWVAKAPMLCKRGQVYQVLSKPPGIDLMLVASRFRCADISDPVVGGHHASDNTIDPSDPILPIADPAVAHSRLEEMLKETRLDLLSSMGETERYKQLFEEIPHLKGLLENAYYEVRDRCSRLLGHLRALETTLKAVTAV